MSKDLEAFLARKAGLQSLHGGLGFISHPRKEEHASNQITHASRKWPQCSYIIYIYTHIYIYMVQKSNLDLITLLV